MPELTPSQQAYLDKKLLAQRYSGCDCTPEITVEHDTNEAGEPIVTVAHSSKCWYLRSRMAAYN